MIDGGDLDGPRHLSDEARVSRRKEESMSTGDVARNLSDVKGYPLDYADSPVLRLAAALRAEGHDGWGAACVILRAYPWASVDEVMAALACEMPPVMPRGWRRGMFSGRQAEMAVRGRS